MRNHTRTFLVIMQSLLLYGLLGAHAAYAQDVSDIVGNIEESSSLLPGLLSAIAYLTALLFGVLGVLKVKDHVDHPQQTPLREPIIRFLAGGALLGLPFIFEVMKNSLDGGSSTPFEQMGMTSSIFGTISFMSGNFNDILGNIVTSIENVPGLISGVAYMIGLLLGVSGILKVKEHVEAPQQTPLREPVIRFVVGGALFALPVIFKAMQETISASGCSGFICFINAVLDTIFSFLSFGTQCDPSTLFASLIPGWIPISFGTDTIGDAICMATMSAQALPGFLNAMAYLFGLILGVWGLLKLKDHVLNPQQVSIWEPVARLIAGGAFFSLPFLIDVARNTVSSGMFGFLNSGFSGTTSGSGLDAMMVDFMANIFGPMQFAINFFCYAGGMIFLMIGVSRLIKSANEGPRGPGGLGTLMTFLTGALLISLSPMIGSFSQTFFGTLVTETNASLVYTTGMTADEVGHVHAIISAILQFMILLGIISVARGIFIMRGVAEGNSQASVMAGVTHILGGALAINLGPVMNAVQVTLGLDAYGVNFG